MNLETVPTSQVQFIVLQDGGVVTVKTDRLIRCVFEAVHQVEWPCHGQNDDGAPEPVLRTLLTYCYTMGILASEEIESAARHDSTIRYLCANHFPDWQEVRAFRRKNVVWLVEALNHVFGCLTSSEFDSRAEAERRLAAAIQADSMAMDR